MDHNDQTTVKKLKIHGDFCESMNCWNDTINHDDDLQILSVLINQNISANLESTKLVRRLDINNLIRSEPEVMTNEEYETVYHNFWSTFVNLVNTVISNVVKMPTVKQIPDSLESLAVLKKVLGHFSFFFVDTYCKDKDLKPMVIIMNCFIRRFIDPVIHVVLYTILKGESIHYVDLLITNIKRWDRVVPGYIRVLDTKTLNHRFLKSLCSVGRKVRIDTLKQITEKFIRFQRFKDPEQAIELLKQSIELLKQSIEMNSTCMFDIFRRQTDIQKFVPPGQTLSPRVLEKISSEKLMKIVKVV